MHYKLIQAPVNDIIVSDDEGDEKQQADGSGDEEDEEDVSDLQIAWEAFEVYIYIYMIIHFNSLAKLVIYVIFLAFTYI